MARNENPPFERGEILEDNATNADLSGIDTNNLLDPHLEGKEWLFEDVPPVNQTTGLGAPANRTGFYVRCRLCRNNAALALKPKRAVKFDVTAGKFGSSVTGYSTTDAEYTAIVDEYLTVDVPIGALFWVVVEGPALCSTGLPAAAQGTINVGDPIVTVVGSTSGATTSGRVGAQSINNGTTANSTNASMIQNRLGRALSAVTSGQTAADLLVLLGR